MILQWATQTFSTQKDNGMAEVGFQEHGADHHWHKTSQK